MSIPENAEILEEKSKNDITHMKFWENPNPDDDEKPYGLWYGFSDKQLEVRDAFLSRINDIVEVEADTRSGKSVLASRLIISLAYHHSNTEWAVIGEGYRDADRSTFKVLKEQIPMCSVDDIEKSPIVEYYNSTKQKIKFTNDSYIYLSTAESPTSLKGSELSGVWCDETYFYRDIYKTLRVAFQRMSTEPRYGVISTTSLEEKNEHHKIFQKGINPKTGESIDWNIKVFTMGIDDNPFLNSEIKEGLERSGNLGSDYFATEGKVYDAFSRPVHVVSKSELDAMEIDSDFRVYGIDFGWDDPLVILEIARNSYGQFVVIDEYYKSKTHLDDAVSYLDRKPAGSVYADWNPREITRMERKLPGFRFENAYKDKDDGISQLRHRLREDSNGDVGLYIYNKCTETIDEIMGYTEDDVGSSTAKDHAMDALRYAVATPDDNTAGSDDGTGMFYVPEPDSKTEQFGMGSIDDYTE